MDIQNKEFLQKAGFKYTNYLCHALEGFNDTNKIRNLKLELKVCSDLNKPISFAFQYGDGLISLNDKPDKRKNILGEFLNACEDNNPMKIIHFFTRYGYILELENDKLYTIDFETITKISNRLGALLDLVNHINDEVNLDKKNLKKILELSLYLFFDPGYTLTSGNYNIKSTYYYLAQLLTDNIFDVVPKTIKDSDEIKYGCFHIQDKHFSSYNLTANEYKNIVDGFSTKDGEDDFTYKAIVYAYANYYPANSLNREIVELLFHFYHSYGIPLEINRNNVEYFTFKNQFDFNDFKDEIISFAKFIIKSEMDNGIKNIRPSYDSDLMKPDWKVDSLLGAMYFSIFYIDSTTEMYRKCQYCNQYFIVKRSSSNKIYCSSYCRNNAQQAKHRLKTKKPNTKS